MGNRAPAGLYQLDGGSRGTGSEQIHLCPPASLLNWEQEICFLLWALDCSLISSCMHLWGEGILERQEALGQEPLQEQSQYTAPFRHNVVWFYYIE